MGTIRPASLQLHKSLSLTLLVLIFILPVTASSDFHFKQPSQVATSNPLGIQFQPAPSAKGYPTYLYDEQVGMTFTQDFTSLAFNVTAVAQTGPDNAGPAYLLNGLTDQGYWYQVGLSYNWPHLIGGVNPGFSMNYEVFSPGGASIFPSSGGGLSPLSVSPGDLVLLSLNFSTRGQVVMLAEDWKTGQTAQQEFSAEGAAYFIGLPNSSSQNGFFSGLMTEQYHTSPYNGTGEPVLYTESEFSLSSAWMWMDEFNTVTGQSLFLDQTPSPVPFTNATLLQYFYSNGTAEASGTQELVTGLSPVKPPALGTGSFATAQQGQQASLTINIQNPGRVTATITQLEVSSDFGYYTPSSGIPLNLNVGATSLYTSITLPKIAAAGNHTLTIVAAWQFLDPQAQAWIVAQPLTTTLVLHVSAATNPPASTPHPSSPPPTGPTTPGTGSSKTPTPVNPLLAAFRAILFPAGLAYALLVLLAVALFVQENRRRKFTEISPSPRFCGGCGSEVNTTMLFCPNCGVSLAGATVKNS